MKADSRTPAVRAAAEREGGWLVCKLSHRELTHGGYLARFARVGEFRRFQAAVVDARRGGTGAGEPPPDRPTRR